MGFSPNVLLGHRVHYILSISISFLIISTSTEMGLIVEVEGRSLLFHGSSSSQVTIARMANMSTSNFLFNDHQSAFHVQSQLTSFVHGQIAGEDKTILVAQIGSRPPRCERRCSSCPHCEAIQVPANPQVQLGGNSSSLFSKIAYTRGDGYSNYKPLSWKCKCGNVIFNP